MTDALFNLGAEQGVIGVLLHANEVADDLGPLRAADFYEPTYGRIFEKATELLRAGRGVDPHTLAPMLAGDPGLGSLGGAPHLMELLTQAPPLYLAGSYAQTVVDLARRRALIAAAEDIKAQALAFDGADVTDLLNAASATLTAATDKAEDGGNVTTAADAVDSALASVEAWGGRPEFTAGLSELDRLLGGFQRGEMAIIAGRPGMGKSIVGLNIARHIAQFGGAGVCYFSLEMSDRALGLRLAADVTFERGYRGDLPRGLRMSDLAGRPRPEDLALLREARDKIAQWPLAIDCRAALTVAEIERTARRRFREMARRGVKGGPIVVDHLGLIRPDKARQGNRHLEVADASRALAEMAKRLDVPVIALCQLNRGVEGREDKRPFLSDLRQAGELEEDARQVILLHRPAYYLREGPEGENFAKRMEREQEAARVAHILNVIVAKNSNGPIGEVRTFVDVSRSAVRDWEC